MISKNSKEGSRTYVYDKRGNLVKESLDGKVVASYTYDSNNKMIKGINEFGDICEYVYNALDLRVENIQTIQKHSEVPNVYKSRSTGYSKGSHHISDIEDLALADKNDKEQKVFKDNYGLNRQNEAEAVTYSYRLDYTDEYNRDLWFMKKADTKLLYLW